VYEGFNFVGLCLDLVQGCSGQARGNRKRSIKDGSRLLVFLTD
jgi:hypothetical protein